MGRDSSFARQQAWINGTTDFHNHAVIQSAFYRNRPDANLLISVALPLVPPIDGGNLAGFLHAAMYQQSKGDISDDKIAIAIYTKALKARANG